MEGKPMDNRSGADELIRHFSREIETLTSSIMTFRIRIAFTVYIGPYLLLGSIIVGTKGNFTLNTDSIWVWLAIAVASALYFGLGIGAGRIEKQAWRQCEKWRRVIIELASGPGHASTALLEAANYTELGDKVESSYKKTFALFLASLYAIGFIVANISTIVGSG